MHLEKARWTLYMKFMTKENEKRDLQAYPYRFQADTYCFGEMHPTNDIGIVSSQ